MKYFNVQVGPRLGLVHSQVNSQIHGQVPWSGPIDRFHCLVHGPNNGQVHGQKYIGGKLVRPARSMVRY